MIDCDADWAITSTSDADNSSEKEEGTEQQL